MSDEINKVSDKDTRHRHSIVYTVMRVGVIPVLLLGIALTIYSRYSVREGIDYEVERSLAGIAHNLLSVYNSIDGGEFSYEDDKFKKGETDITSDYRILDDIKTDTDIDVTIYYGDESRLTTIVDENGDRLTDTLMTDEIKDHVYAAGEEYFDKDIDISGISYYGYYVPIENDTGDIVGVSFAGKPTDSVRFSSHYMVVGNIILSIFVSLLAVFICYLSSSKMVRAIQHIKTFLGGLAGGDFTQEMESDVLGRRDELADMGEYAVHVSISLDDMISRDPLTTLLNRRATMVRIGKHWEQEDFALAMGDIDWFKGVNDTYGHDMGDEVLKYVAATLKEELDSYGFVSRWGGEEFLIGFDGGQEELTGHLKNATKTIREKKFEYGDKRFSVTMTMGVTAKHDDEVFEDVMSRADSLLYQGKRGGRNQIVRDGIDNVEDDGEIDIPGLTEV